MRLDLYVDIAGKQLVANPFGPAPFTLPLLHQGDIIPLRVYLLQRTTAYPFASASSPAFEVLDISDLSLEMAIGTKAGSGDGDHVASQLSWSKNETSNYFYGDLEMNATEMTAAFGSAATLSRTLEIEVTRALKPYTALSLDITVHADVIKDAAVSLQSGQVALTMAYGNATFLKIVGDLGQIQTLRSENGLWTRTIGVSDTGVRIDSVDSVA